MVDLEDYWPKKLNNIIGKQSFKAELGIKTERD